MFFFSILNFGLANFGVKVGFKKCFWSTHVVKRLLFSIAPSILTFDFDLILESFFTFWGRNGVFLGSG